MPHVRCRECVDKYRMTFERGPKKPRPCNCYGYSFPHRKGSLYCQHNPNLTADQLREREEYGRRA